MEFLAAPSDIDDEVTSQYLTSVALVTSIGKDGPNVMAAEWTLPISYDPLLFVVLVNPRHVTYDLILESQEFGLSLCAEDQAQLAHEAGSWSKRERDKLADTKLFRTVPAKHIRSPLIAGCAAHIECRLIGDFPLGDHVMFVGEAVRATVDAAKRPLALHSGRYWRLGSLIAKPH